MIDTGSIRQRIQQFDLRNGSDAITIGGWLVYSNGAMRETNPLGPLIDPPAQPYECCKVQVQYHEALVRRAVVEFDALKQSLLARALANLRAQQSPGPPGDAEVQRLEELRKVVRRRNAHLKRARERLEDSMPGAMQRAATQDAANRRSNERFIADLEDMKV